MNQRAGALSLLYRAIATHQASDAGFLRIRAFLPLIPDYPEALTQDSIMDIQDTFPQRVWQIVASIPKDLSRPTVMSPACRFASGGASGRRSFKTSAGRQHFTMASGGEPPRRNITYRAGSTAATSGITGGRRGGVGKRTNRFTTLSLGVLTLSVTERVGAGLILGRRRNGRRRIDLGR